MLVATVGGILEAACAAGANAVYTRVAWQPGSRPGGELTADDCRPASSVSGRRNRKAAIVAELKRRTLVL